MKTMSVKYPSGHDKFQLQVSYRKKIVKNIEGTQKSPIGLHAGPP